MERLGIKKIESRLLDFCDDLGYQVLLGSEWRGGATGSCWDDQRRQDYNQQAEQRSVWGLCDFQERLIWLHPSMHQQHRLSVLIHELGHILLHSSDLSKRNDQQWEAEAEEVRRLVGEAVGIDLPSNEHQWDQLGLRKQDQAFQRGMQASQLILQSLEA